MADPRQYRYYARSPDGRAILGFDRLDAATEVVMQYGEGAALIDTLAQAYIPMLQVVHETGPKRELVYGAIGGWDTGRFDLDRDLIEAVKKGSTPIVHAFLAKGATANARDARGGTALHWAAGRGRAEVVELLIKAGADVHARDLDGETALDVARGKGAQAIIELLVRSGAASAAGTT